MGISEESSIEPLYEKIWVKYTLSRVMDSIILFLLVLLLCYRVFSYDEMNHHSYPWFLAFMCESWFTFTWLTIISTKWNPSYTISYPHRLFSRVAELPSVDLFVTTADPVLEPPIITVNTVLSLLALDYPSNKLSCYVSDDGCSPLNLYALVEASKFAKLWVPFCKKYNVKTRAPFRFFDSNNNNEATAPNNSPEFMQEWLAIKDGYEHLCSKIQNATKKSIMLDQEFHVFSTTQLNNHPTIIKVIWENKEGASDGVPHLIYVSREKNPNHLHRYKAGAMNVLTRVSGLMTNAPYILNVDCDMHVNNPEIAQHALCILMDPNSDKEIAFVQCPQQFYDGLKDDPFGNQLVTVFVYIGGGVSGIQGIYYVGTNCFHRRKVLYGLSPHHHIQNGNKDLGKSSKKDIIFGSSEEFVESAAQALEGKKTFTQNANLCNSLEAAKEVAASGYEHGTDWGNKVGWMYGSSAEDILTGLTMHTKGWRSESCVTDPIAFMGCTAQDSVVQIAQSQRWGSGLLEIFFSKNCPIFGTIFGPWCVDSCCSVSNIQHVYSIRVFENWIVSEIMVEQPEDVKNNCNEPMDFFICDNSTKKIKDT
ncbi:cellulose synthase-like protein H1 isoform X2 [Arachis stenosperma]|uniref:cellulose synthase-like protein H1 isoform X2 n=1 Tax=Arachis stenosperma TaxID=217475 RepID=UPI0025AC77D5|nr:cellulose synthase-like protein H1 isoform X2 [Arachis stenosperma]